ncbi:MAG: MBL fold metallo-hydrolase [Chitinophagaceae bacterium]|nr:MAG: MBL fold metallo-hydrolase [Chitinophagaceae bacterium]
MALDVCSLNSGSNGNCYYIGNGTEAVLVDAGLSCRETERRMLSRNLDIKKVKGILISHEHTDHIKGIERLSARHNIPVYLTQKTLRYSRLQLSSELVQTFSHGVECNIGSFTITPFKKFHDAIDPHSFLVSCYNVTIGVFTDIGKCCGEVESNFSKCHAVFLESNYDEEMLHNGSYPYHLKKRISGGFGHLSNVQAVELFTKYRSPYLTHVFLSHLSRENNCPDTALNTFLPHCKQTKVVVASRDMPSDVFNILPNNGISSTKKQSPPPRQLSIFDC